MLKILAATAGIIAALAPAPKELPKPKKPPQGNGGTVIVQVLDGRFREFSTLNDGIAPYEIDPQENEPEVDATHDAQYNEMKTRLDEKYARMFELKREIDEANSDMSTKWEEYHALNRSYQKALKRLIASWVTQELYK